MTTVKATTEQFIEKLINTIRDKKAQNIKCFNVEGRSIITDYIILLNATNTIHCKAILTELMALCDAPKISGRPESGWIVIDSNSVVIHVMLESMRQHYDLDSLYEKNGLTYHY